MSKKVPPMPPQGVSERSADLWAKLGPRCQSIGRRVLLEQFLRALDRADEARAMIVRHGLMSITKKTGVVRMNPAARIEKESRALAVLIAKSLHIDWDSEVDA